MLRFITLICAVVCTLNVCSQPLTGIKTIKTSGGDYTSFTAAITALNSDGVGSGGVIFDVDAGFVSSENPLAINTITSSAANPVVFRKAGSGSNPLLQPTGSAITTDFGFKIDGADYITFDGIDIAVPLGNTAVEYGFWIANTSASNGAQYNTIKNCTVTLNKTNTASRGVLSTVPNTPASAAGANSYTKFHNLSVTNAYHGFNLTGNTTYPDLNIEIMAVSGGTPSITNIGNNTTLITYGIFLSSIANYTISGYTINNISTSTGACYGIRHQGTPSYGSCTGNTIQGINASTTGSAYGISITGGGTVQNISNNIISNMGSATGGAYGFEASNSNATHNIYNNTIHSLSCNGTTATNSAYGITNSGANVALNIYNNQIYNILSNGTSASLAAGMNISGTNARIYNNYIYEIKNTGGVSTATAPSTRGIALNTATSNFYVYHNTVYLSYTAGTNNSSAALFTNAASTVNLRNNIFVNNVDVTNGLRAVAHHRAAATLTMFTNTTDDNLYYAGTPSAKNLIFYDAINADQTLLAYQNRMNNREWHSVTELPPFISTVTGSYNLHLNTSIATQCEKGGRVISLPFAVSNDFDGDSRAGTYADIGADEGNFTSKDLTGPYISYTPFNNTTLLTARTLTATITDPSGVATSGIGLPVLYWQINNGGYTPATGVHTGGDTYSFTFGAGVSVTDSITYFVAAQDMATIPNTLAHYAVNATAYTANPPAAGTKPTVPAFYKIVFPLATVMQVGNAGADYNSFTNNGGLFQTIKNGVMTDNLTIYVLTDLTTETGTHDLTPWIEEGVGNYTINIVPINAAPKLIAGDNGGNGLIRLNGVKNITFDGSFGGSGNYLTIRNTNTGGFTPTFVLQNDASNNQLKNTTIEGTISTSTTQLGTLYIGQGINTGCDNNSFINNNIRNLSTAAATNIAVYVIGRTSAPNSNNLFENNQIFNFGSYGFKCAEGNENLTITKNSFYQSISNPTNLSIAIDLGGIGNNVVSGNTIKNLNATGANVTIAGMFIQNAANTTISRNRIYDFPSTTGNLYGIYFAGSSGNPINITLANNQIAIAPTLAGNQAIYGIADESSTLNNWQIYNNSIYVAGANTGTFNSWCFRRASVGTSSNNIIRNNIMANSRTGTGIHYAIGDIRDGAGQFIASNNLYIGTGQAGNVSFFERGSGTGLAEDFTAWTAAKRDLSSYMIPAATFNPDLLFTFKDTCNLSIRNDYDYCWYVNGKGLPLATIADDYDQSNIRSTTLPGGSTDIGCDEFSTALLPPPITATGTHAPGGTEQYVFAGRTLASIRWANTGTLPTLGTLKHYTGVWPNDTTNNNTVTGARYLNEWFDLPATGGTGFGYDLVLNYDSCMLGTIQSEATMIGYKKQTGIPGSWTPTGGSSVNTAEKLLSITGQTGFSEFTATDLTATIPVQLIEFRAQKNAPHITLNWVSASDNSNTQYHVQRSLNGLQFETIYSINDRGIPYMQQTYTCTDANVLNLFPQQKTFYYRLAISEAGSIRYSPIVLVKNTAASEWIQAVFPNPFHDIIFTAVEIKQPGLLRIKIYNSTGQLVQEEARNLALGNHTLRIDLSGKAAGTYTMECTNGLNRKLYTLLKN